MIMFLALFTATLLAVVPTAGATSWTSAALGAATSPAAAPLVARAGAAARLDAAHAAVLDVLSRSDDAVGCDAAQRRTLAANASIRKLGRAGGDDVVLAAVYGSCICGAQNCPYYAIRLTPGRPRVLLSAFGIDARNVDRATPLPGLAIAAHDSAMVAFETTFAYRNGEYVAVASARVRGSDRARKSDIPVRFAPGASSAELRGTVSMGWYDVYTFAAAKGQHIAIDGVRSRANLTFALYGPVGGQAAVTLRPGTPATLPQSGAYRLQIDGDSDADVPYTATLLIR